MSNPFEELKNEIVNEMRELLKGLDNKPAVKIEVIDRPELCKRLALTEPTIIRWEKAGKIPRIEIGSAVRYNWPAVIAALEKTKKK